MSLPQEVEPIQTFHDKDEMMDAIKQIAKSTTGGVRKIRWYGFNGGSTLAEIIDIIRKPGHLSDGFSLNVLAWDTLTSRLKPAPNDTAREAHLAVQKLERALYAIDRKMFSDRYESLSELFSEYLMLGSEVLNTPGHQSEFLSKMSDIISSRLPEPAVMKLHGSVLARKAPHYVPCLFIIIDQHVFVRLYTDTNDPAEMWSQDTYLTTTSKSDLYHQLDAHFSKVWSEASGKIGKPIGMAAAQEEAYWADYEAAHSEQNPSPRIFISYRQDDSKWAASRLYDYLAATFGEASIFLDHATLQTGSKYRKVILSELEKADIVLPIIGNAWMAEHNLKRLHKPDDLVRIELETALDPAQDKHLFPILVDDTKWPDATKLPNSIREIVAHHSPVRLKFASFRENARTIVAEILKMRESEK